MSERRTPGNAQPSNRTAPPQLCELKSDSECGPYFFLIPDNRRWLLFTIRPIYYHRALLLDVYSVCALLGAWFKEIAAIINQDKLGTGISWMSRCYTKSPEKLSEERLRFSNRNPHPRHAYSQIVYGKLCAQFLNYSI